MIRTLGEFRYAKQYDNSRQYDKSRLEKFSLSCVGEILRSTINQPLKHTIMEKELRMAVFGLMLGNSEAKFVSECMRIYNAHHLKRVAKSYARMDVHRAAKRLQELLKPREDELADMQLA